MAAAIAINCLALSWQASLTLTSSGCTYGRCAFRLTRPTLDSKSHNARHTNTMFLLLRVIAPCLCKTSGISSAVTTGCATSTGANGLH